MPAVQQVLVVGAGYAGGAVAGLLARGGVATDVVEVEDDVTTTGSGITVQGNALRVLRHLGAWEAASAAGFSFDSTGFRTAAGALLHELDDVRTGGPDLPATTGMQRRDLAGIVVDTARAHGARFRFGTTVDRFENGPDGVDVVLSDGSEGHYDLVIGADGLRSSIRTMLGFPHEPQPVGMGIWRVFTSRPDEIVRTDLCFDGPCYIAGFCPTGEDTLYAYLVEDIQDRSAMSPADRLGTIKELASHYHGPWDGIRERMTEASSVHYTAFEWMLIDGDWYRDRVVVIGDAAHNCPPTLAQGAAQALEDAAVLSELLLGGSDADAVLSAFMARRFDRAKAVVDVSVQLARWLLEGDHAADIPATMGRTLGMLCQPA